MHWTLDQVRDLDEDEYSELIAWLNERADRAEHGESTDADALVEAMRNRDARQRE